MSPMENIIQLLAQAYIVVIIAAAVMSWMRIGGDNQVVQGIERITQPLFQSIRSASDRYLPAVNELPVDISPIIAILLVHVAKRILFFIL